MMQAQCWFCPKCLGEKRHEPGPDCEPPSKKCDKLDLYGKGKCQQNAGHEGPHVIYLPNGTYAFGKGEQE